MSKKISRTKTLQDIDNFFKESRSKTPKEIKKIKKLGMSHNIKLKEKRKYFCKKCLNPFSGKEKIRIKNNFKNIECLKCGSVNRWKLKIKIS